MNFALGHFFLCFFINIETYSLKLVYLLVNKFLVLECSGTSTVIQNAQSNDKYVEWHFMIYRMFSQKNLSYLSPQQLCEVDKRDSLWGLRHSGISSICLISQQWTPVHALPLRCTPPTNVLMQAVGGCVGRHSRLAGSHHQVQSCGAQKLAAPFFILEKHLKWCLPANGGCWA